MTLTANQISPATADPAEIHGTPSPSPAVSIIIPTYNESAIIENTLDTLLSALTRDFGADFELLFVDDGSRDGTADLLAALIAERAKTDAKGAPADGRVLVLGYPENRGKGYAVRYGMLRARGQKRIFTDADLAYGTEVLAAVAARLTPKNGDKGVPVCSEIGKNPEISLENTANAAPDADAACTPDAAPATHGYADVVIGSRDLHKDGYHGYSALRRLVSRTYRAVLRGLFGLKVTDSQCGIKGFTASAAARVFEEAETNRYAFDFEIIALASRAGLCIEELPVCILNNRKSRIRLVRDSARMLRDVIATHRRLKKG